MICTAATCLCDERPNPAENMKTMTKETGLWPSGAPTTILGLPPGTWYSSIDLAGSRTGQPGLEFPVETSSPESQKLYSSFALYIQVGTKAGL